MSVPSIIEAPVWEETIEEDVNAGTAERPAEQSFMHLLPNTESVPQGRHPERAVTPQWLMRVDCLIILVALCVVYATPAGQGLRGLSHILNLNISLGHTGVFLTCAALWGAAYQLFGVYSTTEALSWRGLTRLARAITIGVIVTVGICYAGTDAIAYHGMHVLVAAVGLWTATYGASVTLRAVHWGVLMIPGIRPVRNVLIIGSGPRAISYYQSLLKDARRKYHVVGFVDTRRHPALTDLGATLVGRLNELESVLQQNVVDEVYIGLPLRSCYREFQSAIHVCERVGVRAVYHVDAFDYQVTQPRYEHNHGTPLATLTPVVRDEHLPVKRAIDIVVSAMAIAILTPVFVTVAVLVMLTSPGPVFFTQERYGQHKRRFRLYKFRSMRIDAEEVLQRDPELFAEYRANHFKLPEHRDPRLTPIGLFIRKASLDELPQLWNVLRGDMSLIGPRPIVPAEIEHYGPFASLLLALKPGLAGAWVVHGRSTVGYPRRAEIELSYVRQWSLLHDLSIFLRTIPAVLIGRGAF